MEYPKRKFTQSFFFKASLLVFPLYIIWYLFIANFADYYNLPTNTRWHFISGILEKKQEIPTVTVLFLGESRVNAGIDFTKIDSSFSFASGGATPVEMYFILAKYLKKHPAPEKVFLSISPRFLCETFAFFPYAVRNDLFTVADFNEILANAKTFKNDTTLGDFPRLKFYAYKLRYAGFYQTDIYRNKAFAAYTDNIKMKKNMLQNNGARFHPGLKASCSLLNYETKYNTFAPAPLLNHYLDALFLLCKNKNIKLIFEFMPMNESSFKVLKSKFKEEYKEYISAYQKKYPQFKISNQMYSYPDTFFGDASHLNSKGKKKFTNSLDLTLKDSK